MGLSGRKTKQKIGNDPRNRSWADDAARFGSNYLAKFGWDSSKGLGAQGEGRTSHIAVSQKLDMLGIGAAHQRDPGGIAWKQNKDFENLLKRMNGDDNSSERVQGFKKAEEPRVEEEEEAKETKKRKRNSDDQVSKKKKKQKRKAAEEKETSNAEEVVATMPDEPIEPKVVPTPPRHRAHRARAIAAKSLSSKSANHISEILGVAPSSSTTPLSSCTPVSSTPDPGTPQLSSYNESSDLETITTSTKTVADYFKEKLRSKSKSKYSNSISDRDWTGGEPRAGLGSSSRAGLGNLIDQRS